MKEEWKPVVGYEGLYEVSSLGNVRSLDRIITSIINGKEVRSRRKGRMLKPSLSHGYLHINLRKINTKPKTCRVHRLVAEAFHGPPTGKRNIVNHENGVKTDNRPENLKWTTHSENIQHAYDTKLIKKRKNGVDNPACTLSESDVLSIVEDLDYSDLTLEDIAFKFNTTITIVGYINIGRSWDHLTNRSSLRISSNMRIGKYNRKSRSVVNCRDEVFDTMVEAAEAYSITPGLISKVCRGVNTSAGEYPDGKRIKWRYNGSKNTNAAKQSKDTSGQYNPAAKLTEEQVLEICNLLDTTKLTQKQIADRYKTVQSVISSIYLGKTWSKLTGRKK